MKFSEKIKLLRNKNNETQQDLANYLNVTFQSISKWENGQNLPTIDVLLEISKHYNVDLEILINDEIILDDKPNNYKEKIFYPSRNKEGLLSIYLDSDGVYTAIYNEKFHRTNTIVATQQYSNENDYIIYLVAGECDDSGYCNHGEFLFSAFNEKTNEIIYKSEVW